MQNSFMYHPEMIMAVAIPLTVMVCVVTGILCSMRVKQWEMSIKHSMIERGMSAEEIKTVLEASARAKPKREWWEHYCEEKAKKA